MTEPAEPENLWSSFLRESSKRTQSQDSTCVVVGSPSNGKDGLVRAICAAKGDAANIGDKELVSYSYFDIDDRYLESSARVNMWSFEEHVFDCAYEVLNAKEQMIFMLCLDLSQSDCIASLHLWLEKISSFAVKYHEDLPIESSRALKQSLLGYLKSARRNKGGVGVAETATVEDQEECFVSDHFGLPIVVVGCQAEVGTSSASMRLFRELQGQIRAVCLEVGAGLVYVDTASTAGGAGVGAGAGVGVAELKKYIMHRLHPAHVGMELLLDDTVERTFVPAGFDTLDLVKISSGLNLSAGDFQTKFQAKAPPTTQSEEPSAEFKADTELESEQAWLGGLHQFIAQVTSSGSAGPLKPLEVEDVLAPLEEGEKKARAAVVRRASVRQPIAAGDKKEVGDFFKNLLKK
eukprot:CAMPEP_0173329490 /NCGR_PEP_ID=MMETSP1144-20121109/2740_1 /TAXON_ID=483371 /ORGANISM="non described non described, Strain CCMP2298" /LENGTH=405 /DNA_ID=CAMNT_0014274097 /DNA_START=148 /DNA_END=1366 /DNA_ORIENTATION=+